MGKTSQQWWDEVKVDSNKLNRWLLKQWRGEVTASGRIRGFAATYAPDESTSRILHIIADQERQHAEWVLELLKARGINPDATGAEVRYWKETLPQVRSFEVGAAVGAHAEGMRLERIRTIAADATAPDDVRKTFQQILKDEVFHERAFREMAGPDAMTLTEASHRRGRAVLGLVP